MDDLIRPQAKGENKQRYPLGQGGPSRANGMI
jgi:hypothetical protein